MSGRILIAGTGSGCGKTTVACALLGVLKGFDGGVAAFKCGPDYIDPLFHGEVLGIPSRNLDLFLCGREAARSILARHSPGGGIALLEGAMGLYDGISGTAEASANEIALATETPTVLVVDAKGKALSLAAQVRGYLDFASNTIAGIILNNVCPGALPLYSQILERHLPVPLLGSLPPLPEAAFSSRHLGLTTPGDMDGLRHKLELLSRAAAGSIDLDALRTIAAAARPLKALPTSVSAGNPVTVAVARDEAFCFLYPDSLAALESLGARIVYFSPLHDAVPPPADGLYLPGGYPELHAGALSANASMLKALHRLVAGGMPTVAECGGFLLLCRSLRDTDGTVHPMAGVIDADVEMAGSPGPFGYFELTATRDNLLCRKGEALRSHQFHYSRCTDPGNGFVAQKPHSGKTRPCVHATGTLWAGYPHIHFAGNQLAAKRFLDCCRGKETP